MGWLDSPETPTPPNPMATAAAQTGTNVSTAIANSYLGSVNQKTPQGDLSFDPNKLPAYSFTDPVSQQTYSIPRWTATQTLNPTAQQTFDQNQQAQSNMSGMAMDQSAALRSLLGTSFNPNAPGMGDIGLFNQVQGPQSQIFDAGSYLQQNPDVARYAQQNGLDPSTFAQQHYNQFGMGEGRMGTGQMVSGYASGGDITRDYGPQDNFSADRQRVEQSMFERVNPQLQQDEQRLRQQLADQGIRYGSQAYSGAYDPYNRQVTDTRLGIVAAGGAEQQRMNQMAQQRALFQNQAQAQAEGQNAARAGFFNTAAQGTFDQAAARGQFYNQAQNQMLGRQSAVFNATNQLRNQALQEQYQLRGQPINEITALLSGSQVAQPNFINAQRNAIPTTDVAGLINQNFAQQNDIFKTQTGTWNDIIGGALGAGGQIGRGLAQSDVRTKENIKPMGSILSTKGALPIYEYDFKNDDPDGQRHIGPMAQDVEKLEPRAVKTIGGVKHIDRDKLGSIFGSA